jgi:SAM-dependent methyltransferase
VVRWAPLVTRGPVLDVASGPGRHARFFAARGLEVIAVDRERHEIPGVSFVQADLEDGTPWPFAGRRFGAIVVTNYLHRPLFKSIEDSLGEGHCFRDQVLDICNVMRAKERSSLARTVEGGSLETIRQMVASGVGVTVLPSTSIGAGGTGDLIRIVPFSRPAPTRRVGLAWRRSFPRPEAIEALRKAILSCNLSQVTKLDA